MGKKNKKNNSSFSRFDQDDINKHQAQLNDIAEHLRSFADSTDSVIIYEGKSVKSIKKAQEVVYKMCDRLEKGKIDKVFNENIDDLDTILEDMHD